MSDNQQNENVVSTISGSEPSIAYKSTAHETELHYVIYLQPLILSSQIEAVISCHSTKIGFVPEVLKNYSIANETTLLAKQSLALINIMIGQLACLD